MKYFELSNLFWFIKYFFSKCNALKFYINFKQTYLLKNSLKIKKTIRIILKQFGSTIVKSFVSQ